MPQEDSTPESLKDCGDLPVRLPVGDWHAFHAFGGHEVQADCHDGLRVVKACASYTRT